MPGKIRILHFIWSANFGGIEKLVIDLTTFQNQNNRVHAEILIGCRKGNFIELLEQKNIPHQFGNLSSGFDFSIKKYRRIKSLMRRFDIVHLHTFNLVVAKAAVDSGTKVFFTIHGNFAFGRKVKFSDHLNNFFKRHFMNHSAAYVTFNSEFTRKTAEARYGLAHVKKKIILNGIPLDKSTSGGTIEDNQHLDFLEGKFVIGTSSRFNGFKRIDRLIDAFALFAENKEDTVLMLVGDGIERSHLEKRVLDKKIAGKTLFTGYQSRVSAYQNRMDVCVFPSENEPFGLVVVETLALGKPVVIFKDSGGMVEILQPAFADDIVDSVNGLCRRLEAYYNDRQSGKLVHKEARILLSAKYDIKTMEEAYYNCYREIAGEKAVTGS